MSSISELYREISRLERRNRELEREISEYEERNTIYMKMRQNAVEDWGTCIKYVGELHSSYQCSTAFGIACGNNFCFYQQMGQEMLVLNEYDQIFSHIKDEIKKRREEIRRNDRRISDCYSEIAYLESLEDDDD